MTIRRTLGHGLTVGAAGVTMLNSITYLDMAAALVRPVLARIPAPLAEAALGALDKHT